MTQDDREPALGQAPDGHVTREEPRARGRLAGGWTRAGAMAIGFLVLVVLIALLIQALR